MKIHICFCFLALVFKTLILYDIDSDYFFMNTCMHALLRSYYLFTYLLDYMVLCASLLSSIFVIPQGVPTLIPVEEIASLEPGQTTKQILQFHFHQQLAIFCNKKRHLLSYGQTLIIL